MADILMYYGFAIVCGFFGVGALGTLLLSFFVHDRASSVFAHLAAVCGGFTAMLYGAAIVLGGTPIDIYLNVPVPVIGNILHFHIDPLAGFFIAIIGMITVPASLFGIRYQEQFLKTYRLGHFGFFYNIFLAAMFLVVSAHNALLFLFFWELMAVASYALVVYEWHIAQNIRAGTLYILVSQIGAACLLGAFLLLYRFTGSWEFEAMRFGVLTAPTFAMNAALALAFVGFATKAGVIPFHIWLPEAHPAAPSHVSALMSGVMLKVAIFMMIRFFVDLFPEVAIFWGPLILLFGAVSSLLGILYALTEHDIKRLLAYSSIENIGIILLGLGASISFFSFESPIAGAIALAAAFYHTVNHALFKSLLFLSAGLVMHATGTRNMEAYGGLIRILPWTSVAFLIGAAAISGLPPLNGFASEWLTFQSLFAGMALLPFWFKITFFAGAASLAFTGGLAAACFVKVFGSIFLARPRSKVGAHAHEAGWLMRIGMGFLTVLTIVFGIAAGTITPVLIGISSGIRGINVDILNTSASPVFNAAASLSLFEVATVLICTITAACVGVFLIARKRRVVISRTWDCGAPLTERMEITATSFSRSLITIFEGVLRPTAQTETEYHDAATRYFVKTKTVHMSLPDLYDTHLYRPLISWFERGARRAGRIQGGNLHVYLAYIFVTVVALLLWSLY